MNSTARRETRRTPVLIVATVLLGPGSEKTVPDAVRSLAPRVDGFVLIESGGGIAAVHAAQDAGALPSVNRSYSWRGDYGAARQFALTCAREMGADYAITLDPDERIELPLSYRERLEAFPEIDVWKLRDKNEGYEKERIIRTAGPARWHGIVCENVVGIESRATLEGSFWELPKTPEQQQKVYERGVTETARMIANGDDQYKWHRHRGTCLMGLGRGDEALQEYEIALGMAESPEDRAWCSYLICEQLVLRDRFTEARELAGKGLAQHAGFLPEFAWIWAYTDYKLGEADAGRTRDSAMHWQNASRWAQIALNMPRDSTRVSFRGKNYVRGCRQVLAVIHGAKQEPAAA